MPADNTLFGTLFKVARENAVLQEGEHKEWQSRLHGLTQRQLARRVDPDRERTVAREISQLESGRIKGESTASWLEVAKVLPEFKHLIDALLVTAIRDRDPRPSYPMPMTSSRVPMAEKEPLVAIRKLVDNAHTSLVILTDVCDYRSGFDFQTSKATAEAIAQKAATLKHFVFLVCGRLKPMTLGTSQNFDRKAYVVALREDPVFRAWFADLPTDSDRQGAFLSWLVKNEATTAFGKTEEDAALKEDGGSKLKEKLLHIDDVLKDPHENLSEEALPILSLSCEWYYETHVLGRTIIKRNLKYNAPSLLYWLADGTNGCAVVVGPGRAKGRLLEFARPPIVNFLSEVLTMRFNEKLT